MDPALLLLGREEEEGEEEGGQGGGSTWTGDGGLTRASDRSKGTTCSTGAGRGRGVSETSDREMAMLFGLFEGWRGEREGEEIADHLVGRSLGRQGKQSPSTKGKQDQMVKVQYETPEQRERREKSV